MTLEDLICKMEIQDLIFHHSHLLDEMEFVKAWDFFTEDGVVVGPDGKETPAIVLRENSKKQQEQGATITNLKPRVVSNVVVTPTGPNTAKAFAYVTLPRPLISQGEWIYDFVKTDDEWRIRSYRANGLERYPGELQELFESARAPK